MLTPRGASTPATPQPGLPADEAIPRLVELQGDRLYRLALRLCPTEAAAEDLVQETWIAALAAWPSFKGESQPYTWLFRIAARTCGRLQRRRAGEPESFLELNEPVVGEAVQAGSPPRPREAVQAASRRLRREAVRTHLDRALAQVPGDFRIALVLKDIADFSLREIGQILDIPAATAKTRVHRGRRDLRDALERLGAVASLPATDTPRHVCLDLLAAKLDAMDRGVPFPFPPGEICDRCAALFRSMDVTLEVCGGLQKGGMPAIFRGRLDALLSAR
ncbi:MAG: RNA polymerase sigma factor [Gemmatimonadetes bacterium]|nr:RNA polymerase sigma factor [Gemmatimonadota bacterium]